MATREELEQLSTEELRKRAFTLAEKRLDVGFFWDLLKHLPASAKMAGEDSFTAAPATLADLLELFQELRGEHLESEVEPLIRAKLLEYVEKHSR